MAREGWVWKEEEMFFLRVNDRRSKTENNETEKWNTRATEKFTTLLNEEGQRKSIYYIYVYQ